MDKINKDVIRILVKGNIKEFHDRTVLKKSAFKLIIYMIVIFMILKDSMNLTNVNYKYIYGVLAIVTMFRVIIYLISTVFHNKQKELLNVLPVRAIDIFTFYSFDILFNYFLKIIFPTTLVINSYMLYLKNITYMECVKYIVYAFVVVVIFSGLSESMFLHFFSKKFSLIIIDILFVIGSFLLIQNDNALILKIVVLICSVKYSRNQIIKYYGKIVDIKIKKINNVASSLFVREFVRFFSDKILIVNYCVSIIMAFFLIIYMLCLETTNSIIIVSAIMMILANTPTLYLMSYEGRMIKQFKVLPFKIYDLVRNKICLSCILNIIPNIVLGIVLLVNKRINYTYMLIIIFVSISISIQKVLIDLMDPIVSFNHTEELLRDSRKYKMYGVIFICLFPLVISEIIGRFLTLLLTVIINIIVLTVNFMRLKKYNWYLWFVLKV